MTLAPTTLRRFAVPLCACTFLAFSGAFGSAAAAWPLRLMFWGLTVGAGSVAGDTLGRAFARSGALDRAPWRAGVVVTLAIAMPVTAIAFAASDLLFAHGRLGARDLAGFAGPTLVISGLLVALNLTLERRAAFTGGAAPPTRPAASTASTAPVRFLARLPPKLYGAELHAVEAQDHYLRLHTSLGSDLILLRLSDAVAELEGIEGAQTHRSWWVARRAVVAARRRDGRSFLELPSGVEAPVSRTFATGLRDAGWI